MASKIRLALQRRRPLKLVVTVALAAALLGGGTAAAWALSSGGSSTSSLPNASAAAPLVRAPAPTTPTTLPATSTTLAPPEVVTGASKLITDTCRYSHEANDDPILMPGRAGQAMAHDFFGNTTTSATSTATELVSGPSTCSTSDDASAYWTPVLYQNGDPITPTHNLIYWAGLHATDPTVTAPPAGLELIAGNENAMTAQSTRVVAWRCATPSVQTPSATPVNCPGTNGLELRVTFPSCWNGSTLNGASQTNAVYPSADAQCPAGYPVRIPTVVFHVVYPITSDTGLTLSMGPGQQGSTDTAHGDFINGWNQSVLTELIDGCSGAAHTCGHVTGAAAVVHPRA
jgi:hypothetical protein